MKPKKQKTSAIMITIDVEDWFQVENFKPYIPFSTWDNRELRVEQNVHRLLDFFDSIEIGKLSTPNPVETQNTGNDNTKYKTKNTKLPQRVRATFFVLGWIAERLPNLIKEMRLRGHEVASHGYNHNLCGSINHNVLKQELLKSKNLLEDITGSEIHGYRAPSFSIDNNILKVIEDCGYRYDSSYNSFSFHGRYGKANLNGLPKNGIAIKMSNNFYELPISNLDLFSRDIHDSDSETNFNGAKYTMELPWGGGGYFRIIPSVVFNYGVNKILKRSGGYLFFIHPWEIDPYQPRVSQAKLSYRIRHYTNLSKTQKKLCALIKSVDRCSFIPCTEYLGERIRQNHNSKLYGF